MRILYAVSGEGAGHSSRAREMLRHLLAVGHTVQVVSYHRGYDALQADFPCLRIEGLRIISVDNRVSLWRTVWFNLRRLRAFARSMQSLRACFDVFAPDLVITDFEPLCARMATARGLPLISLDNQHRMRYMAYESPSSLRTDRFITEWVIRLMVPRADVVLATTFFQGPVRNAKTFLFPPILRAELGALTPRTGDFHLVYVTGRFDSLLYLLSQCQNERFVVYGYPFEQVSGNLHYRPFSAHGFLEDLAACRSVICTAGFTLLSEAMFLGKPVLAFPMQGQFEQQLNAVCLEALEYGMNAQQADMATLQSFFDRLPHFSEALVHYPHGFRRSPEAPRNKSLCAKLDALLANEAALLRKFQKSSSPPLLPVTLPDTR